MLAETVTTYTCEYCGKRFDGENGRDECMKCESAHQKPVSISKAKWDTVSDFDTENGLSPRCNYPSLIEVEMSDGIKLKYGRFMCARKAPWNE